VDHNLVSASDGGTLGAGMGVTPGVRLGATYSTVGRFLGGELGPSDGMTLGVGMDASNGATMGNSYSATLKVGVLDEKTIGTLVSVEVGLGAEGTNRSSTSDGTALGMGL
jgi:hypothetical protein